MLIWLFFLRGCKYNHLSANKTFSFLVPPGHSIHSIHHLFWRLFIAVINKQDAQRRQLGRFSGGSFNEVGGEQPKRVLTNPGLVWKSHLKMIIIIVIIMIIMTWRLSTNKKRSFPLGSRPSALVFPTPQGIITQAAAWRSPFTSKQSDSKSFWQPVRSSDGSFRPASIKLPRLHRWAPAGRSERWRNKSAVDVTRPEFGGQSGIII